MTNRKIKNVQRNMKLREVLDANAENIFTAAVCLSNMGVSHKKLVSMIEEYRSETVPEWEKNSEADVQNAKVRRALAQLGMDFEQFYEVVLHRYPRLLPSLCCALAENLGIFFLQINYTFGFGKIRLERLLKLISEFEGKARDKAETLLNLELDKNDELPDIDALRWKPERFDRQEARQMHRNFDAVRAIQEGHHDS